MNYRKSSRETDFEKLARLKIFSWLNPSEMKALGNSLKMLNFQRNEVILRESTMETDAHVLVSGIARVTCLNGRNERVTAALIAPGAIPSFPLLPVKSFDFRCEAYSSCRVGTMDWNGFENLTANGRETALKKFHQNDLRHWYRLFLRSSGLLNLDLHNRVAMTMLDLCDDFGIEDARGILLKVTFSHKDIASIVGASRPRVTEHLGKMERDQYLVRQGRQFIVCVAKLSKSLSARHAA